MSRSNEKPMRGHDKKGDHGGGGPAFSKGNGAGRGSKEDVADKKIHQAFTNHPVGKED